MTLSNTQAMLHGAKWQLIIRWVTRIVGFASSLILVRLLTPEDFGLVAMATFFVYLFATFVNCGSTSYIVRKADITDDEVNSAWSLNLCLMVIAFITLVVLAKPLSSFVNMPKLENVLYLVSVTPLLTGLKNAGLDLFEKEYNFAAITRIEIIEKLSAVAVSLIIAWYWHSYWALILGTLAGLSIKTAAGYVICNYRPRFSRRHWHEQWHFSKWVFLISLSGYFRSRLDIFLIGRLMDSRAVGLYNVAQEFAWLPATELVYPLNRALYPVLSKNQSTLSQISDILVKQLAVLMMIVIPSTVGIILVAEPFVHVVLGEQWTDALPVFQAMAPLMITSTLYGPLIHAFTITTRMRLIFLSDVLLIGAISLLFYSYASEGLETLSYIRAAVALFFLVWLVSLGIFTLGMPPLQFAVLLGVPAAASLPMAVSVSYCLEVLNGSPQWLLLVVASVSGALVYALLIFAFLAQCRKSPGIAGYLYAPLIAVLDKVYGRVQAVLKPKAS
ncbi:lipopolysaccharide biosynthesis protein [Parasalinivibrio latis]|uniref:lipopolysaccharide biosynthesis protein n=1 Tax=Parasalinivibrio latis TaxID=2952610 RepID=UPI0030DF2BA7